jgi:cell shape-determining protein MreC
MKKILFQRRNALMSPAGFSAGVYLIVTMVLIVLFRIAAPNVFFTITSPAFTIGTALTERMRMVRAVFIDHATLAFERDMLREKNTALEGTIATLEAKLEALVPLRDSSGVASGIVAGVLAGPPQSPYDTLILGSGSTAGLAVGMQVRGDGGIPLGEVRDVTATSARVTLYSTPGHSQAAWVGSEHTPITLIGRGGGSFVATVPKATRIDVGDRVYLANGRADVLGRVDALQSDPASPSTVVHVSMLVNLFSIVWVTVSS